jgi:ribosomal-protein-alanine N-acetyltransferase
MGRTGLLLQTDRLLIRELTAEDVPALALILGDVQVMRHSVRGVLSEKATREFVTECIFSYQGRGLATEAAKATLEYAFGALGIDSVIAIVEPENIASVNVIEKLGFNTFIHSQYHRRGVKIYRMTRQCWGALIATPGEAT